MNKQIKHHHDKFFYLFRLFYFVKVFYMLDIKHENTNSVE